MRPSSDEFYVGYLPAAPPRIARVVRRVVVGLIVAAAAVAVTLVAAQAAFPVAVFEFGAPGTLRGRITDDPVPALLVDRPARTSLDAAVSRYLLTVPGKHGAENVIGGLAGHAVELEGTLIYRDGVTMVEIVPGSVRDQGAAPGEETAVRRLGRVTLQGEIVDSKCFLGVMNPGQAKPHRACAARCISGGAPPMLVVAGDGGDYHTVLLVSGDGRSLVRDLLPYVAEPVEITGELERAGDLWILRSDRSTLRRLE